jgi:hypothetical protein
MKTRLLFELILTFSLAGPFAAAQTPAPAKAPTARPAARKTVSQVDQVIQLTKAGVAEGVIIQFLQKNGKATTLTADDLVRLQQAGVSQQVMSVMIDPTANPAAAPAPAPGEAPAPPPPAPIPAPVSAPPPPPAPAPVATPPVRLAARVSPSTGDWRAAIQQRIESDYPLTQASGDKTDIVTAGAVIILKKNSLVFHTEGALSNANTYKGGKLSAGFFGSICKNAQDGTCRTFVKGEKFWLIDVDVKEDGLLLQFLSDPMPDSRYSGSLKFPFGKGSQHTPDEMAGLVAEVLGVDGSNPPATVASAPATPQQPPLAPIAPPPAPPDQPAAPPATVALGQTKDQVIAALGQPVRVANIGTKQILYFNGLKVTLVNGKVTDVK